MLALFERNAPVEEQPSSDDWRYVFVDQFNKGMDLSKDTRDLADPVVIDANGVRITKDRLALDFGFKKFGQVVRGVPRIAVQFFKRDGTTSFILITDDTFYRWVAAESEWQYVSNGTSTTLTASADTPDTQITVADTTGFVATEFVGLLLDDGTQHKTTIASIDSGTLMTLDDTVPSLASSGNAIIEAVALSGTSNTPVDFVPVPFHDWLIFVNGVDAPQKYDGTTVEPVPNLPTSPFIASVVKILENHVMFFNLIEAGVKFPQKIRWSDTSDATNWTTGNAGFANLWSREDAIKAAVNLDPYLIVYKERSIVRIEFIGQTNLIFNFVPVVGGEGVRNGNSVIDLNTAHMVFGKKNIYIYTGQFSITPTGSQIGSELFGQNSNLNKDKINTIVGIRVEELDEIWFFYPLGSDVAPKNMVRYKIRKDAWAKRSYSINITGKGVFKSAGGLLWNQLVGSWERQDGSWLSFGAKAEQSTIILCSSSPTNQVYEYDFTQVKDDGVDISYAVETKDFYQPNRFLRFDRFEFDLIGSGIEILCSLDRGESWTTFGTYHPGGASSFRPPSQSQTDLGYAHFSGTRLPQARPTDGHIIRR